MSSQFATAADSADVAASVATVEPLVHTHAALSDTTDISALVSTTKPRVADHPSKGDSANISAVAGKRVADHISSTADIDALTEVVNVGHFAHVADTVDISALVTQVTGAYIQEDTWRPVALPTNNDCLLVCRSPVPWHDSLLGLQHTSFWIINPKTVSVPYSEEWKVLNPPNTNGYGWNTMSHPEWSPDGKTVAFAVQTDTEDQIVLINSAQWPDRLPLA